MSVIALHPLGPHSWTQVLRRLTFFFVLFVYSFTRFLHNGLSLFSDFPFIILLLPLLSLNVTIFLFLTHFFLYFQTLPLFSVAYNLPVCPQLPNIFHFLMYFLYISISFLVLFIFPPKYSK